MINHLAELAAAASERFHHHANKRFRAIDDQALEGFQFLAILLAHDNFRFADHQLVAFATHRLDEDGELQFAARQHAKYVGRFRIGNAQRHVGQQFFLQT